ncbi:ABC transporter ATP-binding protein [Natrialbaceae archaeon A-chndr2]
MAIDDGSNDDARLSVANVGKRYSGQQGAVQALEDVSFEIRPGEFVCVVGPSGSGKTTLFRIVGGLEEATTGGVSLNGDRITGPHPDTGIVFQEYHLFPWRTVRSNVAFGLEHTDLPKAERERRVADLISLVGLSGFEDSYPKSLSGGMKQRVGLARALAMDPSLLLLDEPFGALDAQTKTRLQDELLDIWARTEKTVLFITHDVEEAVTLADRILVMDSDPGRIHDVVDIDLPRPRSRTDPAFGEYYERVLEGIRD